ncbi:MULTISPECIES: hypothetical protein [Acidobacterium]|uniref:Uncharacterized protein n=1 Tax=Acidobacterium capsulatum (strain ATCC 51196 / DSM 11244 / BCRC 80197 / JCM 7670 / NBRC 15755 / NCIMB 13165 / 161) TaxID=240015 RepID=C1FA14_ACIC5|nr:MULTISPECIES: hypothetical protein [Acidobacterium]ACO31829.1 hypothetical protein ACP_0394 [Acidobacterium capsulatum ATCC 51196]HCT62064.1 hypothetical protein [Acidobacterium sp.]
MTRKEILELAGSIVTVVLVALFAVIWLRQHDAQLKAQATAQAQRQVIQAQQQQIDAAKADIASTAATLKQQLATIAVERAQAASITPQQFIQAVPKVIQIPVPLTLTQPAPQTETVNGKAVSIPAAPEVQIPAADLPAFETYKLDCDAANAKLSACSKTSADQAAQVTALQAQLAAEKKTADGYRNAARGGSVLQRIARGAKCLAIQGAAAYGGASIDKRQPGVGAAIGTVAGGLGCQIF